MPSRLLNRAGGLLQQGGRLAGGLFGGPDDDRLDEQQNRAARSNALITAGAAALSGQGRSPLANALMAGRHAGAEGREQRFARGEEEARKARLQGLLGGGLTDANNLRGLLSESIASGDIQTANLARGLIGDLQPGSLASTKVGNDTVLYNPSTGEEVKRFAGDIDLERVQVGDYMTWRDKSNPSRIIHREHNPRPEKSDSDERKKTIADTALYLAQYGIPGREGAPLPTPDVIAQTLMGEFENLTPADAIAKATNAVNRATQIGQTAAGRGLVNEDRAGRLDDETGGLDPAIRSDVDASVAAGKTREQIIKEAEVLGPFMQQQVEAYLSDPAAGPQAGGRPTVAPPGYVHGGLLGDNPRGRAESRRGAGLLDRQAPLFDIRR